MYRARFCLRDMVVLSIPAQYDVEISELDREVEFGGE